MSWEQDLLDCEEMVARSNMTRTVIKRRVYLTSEQKDYIAKSSLDSRTLAHMFNVNTSTIRKIRKPGRNIKLTPSKVREIRALKGKVLAKVIARMYGVGPSTICDILRGETWREVSTD